MVVYTVVVRGHGVVAMVHLVTAQLEEGKFLSVRVKTTVVAALVPPEHAQYAVIPVHPGATSTRVAPMIR